jgi:transcription elongation GreA/GreB family factor
MDSPLGKTLLGKRLGDEVPVLLPAGQDLLTIVSVHYGLKPPERS